MSSFVDFSSLPQVFLDFAKELEGCRTWWGLRQAGLRRRVVVAGLLFYFFEKLLQIEQLLGCLHLLRGTEVSFTPLHYVVLDHILPGLELLLVRC